MHQLPDTLWSPEDLKEAISDLQRYAQLLANGHIKQRAGLANISPQPPALSAPATALLSQLQDQEDLTQPFLESLVDELQKIEASAPRITFTLAAIPPRSLKKALVAWSRANLAPDILVSFRFNATILGGMVVQYGSHVFDWSFRRQILAARHSFPGVLRRV